MNKVNFQRCLQVICTIYYLQILAFIYLTILKTTTTYCSKCLSLISSYEQPYSLAPMFQVSIKYTSLQLKKYQMSNECHRGRAYHSEILRWQPRTLFSMSVGWYLRPRNIIVSSMQPTTYTASCRSTNSNSQNYTHTATFIEHTSLHQQDMHRRHYINIAKYCIAQLNMVQQTRLYYLKT